MLRAAAWTGGLFALGGAVVHFFPGPLVEPIVLLALGTTLFLVSARPAAPPTEDAASRQDEGARPRASRAERL